jgi:hypothetical protein
MLGLESSTETPLWEVNFLINLVSMEEGQVEDYISDKEKHEEENKLDCSLI